ncbi:VOC family protein [Acaryochloris sp. IP29b_bin.148]|uniref:VOC family protein n=1 Tax=Acaryochloris sp. IP29b_bin.148 TaxID=2969218 RepID=UPI00261C749E|nr:VOC family protein [Acaryochloris sp. IP29b_bin.148]
MSILAEVKDISVSFAVKDLDATAKWYQDYLGFKQVLFRDFPEYGTRIVFLEINDISIELIEDQKWTSIDRPSPPQHTTVQGVSQVRFMVHDIEKVVERVKAQPEIEIAWDLIVVEDIGFKEFFIRDNEGNILQFAETFEPKK